MAVKELLVNAIQGGKSAAPMILARTSKDHTFTAHFDTGSLTVCTVNILGSIDNQNYFIIGSHDFSAAELTAKRAMFHILDKPINFLKAEATVITGTGKVTVRHEALGDDDSQYV